MAAVKKSGKEGMKISSQSENGESSLIVESKEISPHKIERFCSADNTIVQSGKTSISKIGENCDGIRFMPIKEAISLDVSLKKKLSIPGPMFSTSIQTESNLACFEAGIYIDAPEGASGTFRHILVSDANLADRSVVTCGKRSDVTLIIDQRSATGTAAKRNGYLEARLGERSTLMIIELHRFNNKVSQAATINAEIGKMAKLIHIAATIGGGESDTKNKFIITGHGGEVIQRHVTLASGKEDHKTDTRIIHRSQCGRSDVAVRSVADDNAKVVSHSTVQIETSGQKTISRVTDHSMMISPGARCESIPSMEILANDVQAGHSASTCQIDPDSIFYLQARGLDEAEAKKQIVTGFLKGIFDEENLPSSSGVVCINELIEDRFETLHHDPLLYGLNRDDFPILNQKINGKPLAYLDSAATSQKPKMALDAMESFYLKDNANINRGINTLGERATGRYETARKKVAQFINAKPSEIVFVRNATEALNLIAYTLARQKMRVSDRILLTAMEHHSNIVPWQLACAETKSMIDVVEVTPDGLLDLESLRRGLAQSPKIFSFTHVSNVLGTINDAKELTARGHQAGAVVVVDGAQSAPHMPIDVKDIDCDVFVFSGHKMLGPTGIGALYVKQGLLNELPPFLGGGGMIKEVSFEKVSFKSGPERFEAGTPDIAGAVGLGAAIDYLETIGMENVKAHNDALLAYAWEKLSSIKQVKLYGPAELSKRAGAISFNLGDIHAHDVSSVLDEEGVEIRAGNHCAMPLMDRMGVAATCRASFHIYNSKRDVDQLVEAIKKAIKVFRL